MSTESTKDADLRSTAMSALGRIGGLAKSERKAHASRKNGLLGGRPRKPKKTKVKKIEDFP